MSRCPLHKKHFICCCYVEVVVFIFSPHLHHRKVLAGKSGPTPWHRRRKLLRESASASRSSGDIARPGRCEAGEAPGAGEDRGGREKKVRCFGLAPPFPRIRVSKISKVVSTHLWNTPLNLYQQAVKGILS